MRTEPVDPADVQSNGDDAGDLQPDAQSWTRYVELLVAVGVVAMGAVILIDLQDIRVPRAFSSVGPRVVPSIVGWGLIVLGAWYAIDILKGHTAAPSADSEDADPTLPADWPVMLGLGFALVVYALLMEPAGFVVASAVLFVLAAFSMGSRQYVRDIAIGVIGSLITFVAFSEWLGIRLPAGILDRFF